MPGNLSKKKYCRLRSREKELIELCDKYRSSNGEYDCLIPGSGGKDSFTPLIFLNINTK